MSENPQMTATRYWLFAGHKFYPLGGMGDLVFIGTLAECRDYFETHDDVIAGRGNGGYVDNWGEIYDSAARAVVARGSTESTTRAVQWVSCRSVVPPAGAVDLYPEEADDFE